MKKLVITFSMLALCSLSVAQEGRDLKEAAALAAQNTAAEAALHSPFAPADCAFTFISGGTSNFLKFCVTANGNITVFESPLGHEHIAIGKDGEGYGICDLNSNVAYDDYAEFGDSGNWQPATVLSRTATSVKISRTSSDGHWTLTQTFGQIAGIAPSARVTMALRNNAATARSARLLRYVDVDADGVANNNLDATLNSVFGWNSLSPGGVGPFGLVLHNLSQAFPSPFVQATPIPPSPCDDHTNSGPLFSTDGSLVLVYNFSVGAHATVTVPLEYKGL